MNEEAKECIVEYFENKGQKTSIEDDIVKIWKDLRLFQCRGAACPVLIEHPVRKLLSRPSGAN